MGSGTFNPSDWDSFTAKHTTGKRREEIFRRDEANPDFDPRNIEVRESCDSDEHPNSTPIIVALDVTGSMGSIPEALVRDGLSRMATEILDRQPIEDPQLMFMAVGDAYCDGYPLQATQFESDIRIAEQLKELYLEGGGGGNRDESYHLPWYFAARKTQTDAFEKRGQKGILFTIGDEGVPPELEKEHIYRVFGDKVQGDIDTKDLLRMVEERYEVFHLVVKEGYNYKHDTNYVKGCWADLLGQRAIPVSDFTKIPEVIVSTLELMAGKNKMDITKSWDKGTALVVKEALGDLTEYKDGGTPSVWRPGS